MVDQKISQLTADAAPASTDETITNDDTIGSPITKRSTWANIFAALQSSITGLGTVTSGDISAIIDTFDQDVDASGNAITNLDRLVLDEGGTTDTPASGHISVYAKANGRLYFKDDTGLEIPLIFHPDEMWGGNLVMNYPSIEIADGAQPEWWEEEDANVTLTEEDATGASIPQKYERVLKIVNGAGGGGKYIYQRYTHADDPHLDDSTTQLSMGCWVYTADAGTVTLEMYNVGGAASLGTDTTTTTSTWVWLAVESKTVGTTNTDIRIKHSANSATLYVAMPMVNVGPLVRPWKSRGLVYKTKFTSDVVNKDPADTNWADADFTSASSNLAAILNLKVLFRATAAGVAAFVRPNGSSEAQTDAALVIQNQVANVASGSSVVVQCDDGQIIEESVNSDVVDILRISCAGYWEWE